MSILNCRYYGFECNYEMEGKIKTIADKFKNHIKEEHGINYPKEILTNRILRKKP
jgi:predicted small metal-binding protein